MNDGDYVETHKKIRLYENETENIKYKIEFLKENMDEILESYFISEPNDDVEDIEITYTDEDGITRKVELKEDPYEDDYEYDYDSDLGFDNCDNFD